MKVKFLCLWSLALLCSKVCIAQTILYFSAPTVDHIGYFYGGAFDATEMTLMLVDGGGQKKVIASSPSGFYGKYRVPMDAPPYQVILRTCTSTATNETVQLALPKPTEIAGRAEFDETIEAPANTTSQGFTVAAGVTVTVSGGNIQWQGAMFDGFGDLTLNGCQFPSFSSSVSTLTLSSCKADDALFAGTDVSIQNCLFNGGVTLNVVGSVEMSESEVAGGCTVQLSGDVLLHDNTFYSMVNLLNPTGHTTVIRNNTLLFGLSSASPDASVANNYYGAPWSKLTTESGWLNPYHLDPVPCLDDGLIIRCSLSNPRNAPLFRSIRMAAGHSVMTQQSSTWTYNYYPENFVGRIRVGLPFAMAFDLKSSAETLPGVHYELVYNGTTYQPANPFTATARYEVNSTKNNASFTLNFILPAPTETGTNNWQLFADFGSCGANIVKPSPARICIADGGIPIQPGFARPFRIGVMEIELKDGSAIGNCGSGARSKAIARLKNDLLAKLGLTEQEIEVLDLGYYTFSGGLLSSWISQTDIGRANQLSSELEWFIGDYNSSVSDPLDFVVGVAPVNALGGADGLSMALRRHAVLVDEFSPDAALHEIGHSMGLYTSKEQYNYSYSYAYGGGFYSPGRGLELGELSAFNPSSKPDTVVSPGTIRHFPGCMHNGVYDLMGAANPQWISTHTYFAMNQWFTEHLKLKTNSLGAGQAYTSGIGDEAASSDAGTSRIVHVAAIYSRLQGGDVISVPSLRMEEVVGGRVVNDGIYNLNYRFQTYDQDGFLLSSSACQCPGADYITNSLWHQTFSVPAEARQYKLVHIGSSGDPLTYVVWTSNPSSGITNELQAGYNAGADTYDLSWSHSGTRRDVENRLLISDDGGANWSPLPLPTYTNSISIPRAGLAKNSPQFKLVSSDGFHSATSAAIQGIPETALPPVVRITSPAAGAQGITNVLWQLAAEVADPNQNVAAIVWSSSLDGVLGNGPALSVNLSAGSHVLQVVATDSTGLSATGSVNVVVGALAAVDLSVSAADIRVAPISNGYGLNTVGYGQTNTLSVAIRNQGVTNRVEMQVYCTRPGEPETSLYDQELLLTPFDEQTVSLEFFAPSRGLYKIRAVCTSLDFADPNPLNNSVTVNYTNLPPKLFANRLSVLAESLPLQVPLVAQDPNGDPVTFALIPATGASLAQNTLRFDNGGASGSYPIQITASDGDLTSSPATLIVDVYSTAVIPAAPVITSSHSFTANVNEWVSFSVTVTNGPCTFASTGLPAGLYLDAESGLISGQVATAGTYVFSVTAANDGGSDSAQMTLQVNVVSSGPGDSFADAVSLAGTPVAFQGSTTGATHEEGEPNHAGTMGNASIWWRWTAPSNGVVGIQWNGMFMPAAVAVYTGNAINALTEAGSLFGFNAMTCFNAVAGREYFIALDAFGDGTFSLNLAYHPEPILRDPLQVVARQNQPVDLYFQTWNAAAEFSATGLPDGLVLNPTTGRLTGAPSGFGYSTVTLLTTNAAGGSTAQVTFEIRSVNAPVFTSPLYATAALGEPFNYQITATNASPGTLYANPLPEGLVFNNDTGVISGSPTECGTFTVYLNAGNTNTAEYVSDKLTLLVRTSFPLWLEDCGFSAADLANPLITGSDADPDHDGACNRAEFIAGTNPRDPNDVLRASLRRPGSGLSLEWPAKAGLRYRLLETDTLGGSFSIRSNNILPTPPSNIITIPAEGRTRFFQVQVEE